MALHSGSRVGRDILVSDEKSGIYHIFWNAAASSLRTADLSSLASGVNFEEGRLLRLPLPTVPARIPGFAWTTRRPKLSDGFDSSVFIHNQRNSRFLGQLFDSTDLVNWQNLGPFFIPAGARLSSPIRATPELIIIYKMTSGSCCSTNAVGS